MLSRSIRARHCMPRPRAARAVDGLILGTAVGVLGAALVGGMVYAFDRTTIKPAMITALGVFGVAVLGETIVATQLPQC